MQRWRPEHKSHNLIELENGQYACILTIECVSDNSLTPVEPKMPDFKVSTQYYQVEMVLNVLEWDVKMNILEKIKRT